MRKRPDLELLIAENIAQLEENTRIITECTGKVTATIAQVEVALAVVQANLKRFNPESGSDPEPDDTPGSS